MDIGYDKIKSEQNSHKGHGRLSEYSTDMALVKGKDTIRVYMVGAGGSRDCFTLATVLLGSFYLYRRICFGGQRSHA